MREALLEFARQRNYAAFEWLPSSTIVGNEKSWNAFARTHTVRELFWVLHVAKEAEGYISALGSAL
ncbi:hypothetical protein [Dictyobacter kobayashii]|uniref:Uncharacterized protein n=1 Tax=Dictyobacter kobayashii TaxID=2014872 RepID=A0A402AUL8_9CHLR|nr:hypothetical protein [Dictyobacter kobayashii]GCE22723.1 hypothetical protein KDK_65230 [Dictyobacter kobayashii]